MSCEVMQLALEALEKVITAFGPGLTLQQKAATALRQALAQPKQEPFEYWTVADGWVYANDTSQERVDEIVKDEHEPVANIVTGLRLKETS